MIIPLRSDTRMDHIPYVTISFILLNILVFILVGPPWHEGSTETQYFILDYQGGVHPIQWVLSAFAHADIFHLGMNMIFLWAFGMIVEGDVGHIRFTAIYFVSIVAIGLIEQIIFYNNEGGSLGASSAIYSLMMISLLWVPHNEIECVYLIWFRPGYASIKIQWFSAIYFVLDLINSIIYDLGSSFLHLIGGFVGLAIGSIFLYKKWVDPEGWDFYSIYFKKHQKETSFKSSDTKAFQLKYQVIPSINKTIQLKNVEEAIFLFDSNTGIQNDSSFDRLGFSKLLFEREMHDKLIELSEKIDSKSLSEYHLIQLFAARAVMKSSKDNQLLKRILLRIEPTHLAYSDKIIYLELKGSPIQQKSDPEDPLALEEL